MTSEAQEKLKPYLEDWQTKYHASTLIKVRSDFYDAYIKYELEEKMIFYEAFYGRGITCSPGEMFRYLIKDERFKDFTHVWSLEQSEGNDALREELKQYDNVITVEPQTEEYFRYLTSAKYLFNNSTWNSYFIKRDGQVIINTWHGIPLKSLAFDEPNGGVNARNMLRNFLMSDYVISPVPYTTENFKTAFRLDGLFEGEFIEAGYPRTDATVNFDKKALKKECEKFGVAYDENKKLILYAPTWRGESFSKPEFAIGEYEEFMALLNSKINTDEYQVLFKPHQQVYSKMVESGKVKKEFVPAGINTNLLLGGTDILISDYSSIFFDFLVTGRPILFYIPDLDKYKTQRGLYMTVDSLPGPTTQSADEVAEWLSNPDELDGIINKEKYYDAVQKYVCNDDGHVCEKVTEAIFFGDKSHCIKLKNDKPKILLHTDMILANGISFSAFNLMQSIDTDKYDVTFFSTGDVEYSLQYIKGLPRGIRVYFKPDRNTANIEALARIDYCKDNGIAEVDGDPLFPSDFYAGEYKRCFGDVKFDCIVDFSGFNSFYVNMYLTNKDCKKVIWMHSVMMSEYGRQAKGKQIFKGHLDCIFKTYPFFDKIVSCSRTTMETNRADLATDETYPRFTYAKNMIDVDRIIRGVENKKYVDIDGVKYIYLIDDNDGEIAVPAPRKEDLNFATVGRLSDMKNHINLIKAFKRFNKENPNSRLYIIGDGPNAKRTTDLRDRLNIADNVILAGNITNPFSILSDCDCFMLPSTYEGQPMVILEARVLGLPVIVSNFDTVKDSMYENGQLLIGMEEDDIYNSFVAFKNGEVPNEYKFDAEQYNREAMEEFESIIN